MRERFLSFLPLLFVLTIPILSGCVPPGMGTSSSGGVDSTSTIGDNSLSGASLVWGFVHGAGDLSSPPILKVAAPGEAVGNAGLGASALTLRADLLSEVPPSLNLVLVHCDRNWVPTKSVFIQDRALLRATDVEIFLAPPGVRNYDYSATVTFPSQSNNVEIRYSGNYLARLVNAFNENEVVAEFRFFAVEPSAGVDVRMISAFFNSAWTSKLQEGLSARIEVSPGNTLFSSGFEAIHLIEQGKWDQPLIASDDQQRVVPPQGGYRSTFSTGFAGRIIATYDNIPSGNEHRILDLTDLVSYPPVDGVISTRLSDQPRFATFDELDNNGLPVFNPVDPAEDDYIYFEFRLDIEGTKVYDDMAVVGSFNNWTPTWDWRLVYDPDSRRYVARGWIKRAVHEYEYVSGAWNVDRGVLERAEGTLLEGNSVYATQIWYGFAYYRDQSSLSYDRIVGAGIDQSGGR